MEIKVQFECGQRYAFEVEPEDGCMPAEVSCPSCGQDGTAKANDIIQAKLKGDTLSVSQPESLSKLRLSRSSSHETTAPPASPVPASDSGAVLRPASSTSTSGMSHAMQALIEREERRTLAAAADQPRIGLGILGAIIGGIVGMTGWYFLIVLTKVEIGYAAWGVGLLCGFGAKIGCRYTGPLMGLIAGGWR